jgi:hypothetical protein
MDRTRTELIAFIVIQPLIFLCPPTKRRQSVVRIALSVRLSSELTKLTLPLIKLHSRITLVQNFNQMWPFAHDLVVPKTSAKSCSSSTKCLRFFSTWSVISTELDYYTQVSRPQLRARISYLEFWTVVFFVQCMGPRRQGLQPIAIQDHDQLNFFWMQHGKSCLIDQWCNVRVGNLAGIPRRSKISTTWRLRWKFDLDRSISIRRIAADRATTSALWNKRGETLDEITSTAIYINVLSYKLVLLGNTGMVLWS